jgi:hypothetical protein
MIHEPIYVDHEWIGSVESGLHKLPHLVDEYVQYEVRNHVLLVRLIHAHVPEVGEGTVYDAGEH